MILRLTLGAALFVTTGSTSAAASQEPDRIVGVNEFQLRRAATGVPAPEYPRASLDKKATGVAVADVVFGADGRPRSVTVVEAPDSLIADAVKNAVMQWAVTPVRVMGRPEPYGMRGKLTLYFRIIGGKGRVVSPEVPAQPKRPRSAGPPAAAPRVDDDVHGGPVTEITDAALTRLTGTAAPIVLDIGDRDAFRRGHRDGAINIPHDELDVRAKMELDPKKAYVVDCTQDERPRCNLAYGSLREMGFSKLAMLVR